MLRWNSAKFLYPIMTTSNSESAHIQPRSLQEIWLNPRRKRFWAILLVLLYTVCGFFLVPVLVNKLVVDTAREKFGREASLQKVRFNPYTLSLRATGFGLIDTDDVKLVGFDEFVVNFQLSSLYHRAWTFREVRLDGAYLYFERFALDDTRLSRLLADADSTPDAEELHSKEDSGLPRLLIHDLSLNGGSLDFRDRVPATPVDLNIGPINVSIQELNTLPDQYGQQSVMIQLPGDTTLKWQGNLSLAPLDSEGELAIENSHLSQTIAYLEAVLPLESMNATMSMSTRYRVKARQDGNIAVALDDLAVNVTDVAVSGLDPVTKFFSLGSLELSGGKLRYPENEIRFARVHVSEPGLVASLDQAGRLNLLDLKAENSIADSGNDDTDSASTAWQVEIEKFVLDGGQAEFADNSISPPAAVSLSGLQFSAENMGNEEGRRIPLKLDGKLSGDGSFGFAGEVVALPEFSMAGQASASDIQLQLVQPYLQQALNLRVENGSLNSVLDVAIDADKTLEISGELAVAGLDITDTVQEEKLLGWDQLEIDRFELDGIARKLRLSSMKFERPFGRFKIYQDMTTNLSGLAVPGTPDENDSVDTSGPAWAFVIGGININDASMDFSDLSLPLPFATHITAMDGTLSTMDTSSSEPSNIRLEGQVDEYGLARIEGAMSVFEPVSDTDVTVEFRNLLMSNLSPYSAQFAGQKIDEGKLNLDLEYIIKKGQMQGSNQMILSGLVLGDKVDNPEAASLPLGLAVALLTDSNGVIDIDLPVQGDINDPEFKIGGVIWKAFSGLITKIVSAPFRLLGNLIGVDSEDLGQFQFLAGRSDLTPPELEKIAQLQQALQQRPELRIEIKGPYDSEVDTPKLQFFSLREQVVARLDEEAANPADESGMLDEEIRSVLELMLVERFPEQSLSDLKAAQTRPPLDDPEGKPVLDDLAYAAELRDRLLAAEVISTQDLEQLANNRAETIRSAFLADGSFAADRVVVTGTAETESDDGEWVVTELGVAAD